MMGEVRDRTACGINRMFCAENKGRTYLRA
jgi:hypothetical protein